MIDITITFRVEGGEAGQEAESDVKVSNTLADINDPSDVSRVIADAEATLHIGDTLERLVAKAVENGVQTRRDYEAWLAKHDAEKRAEKEKSNPPVPPEQPEPQEPPEPHVEEAEKAEKAEETQNG